LKILCCLAKADWLPADVDWETTLIHSDGAQIIGWMALIHDEAANIYSGPAMIY
jgi:hypothetical protein